MNRLLFFSIAVLFLMTSCLKEKVTDIPQPDDYLPMKIGNEWIYETYGIDNPTGQIVNTAFCGEQLTIRIVGDTIVNGFQYFEFETTTNGNLCSTRFLRKNEGVLYDIDDIIVFSPIDFTNILHIEPADPAIANSAGPTEYQMFNPSAPVNVSAGTFDVLEYRATIEVFFNGETRECSNFYAKDVGLIKRNLATLSGNRTFYQELVSYTLN